MAGYQSGPAIDNLDPTMREIALKIVAESGGRVWIGSGWRSPEQQRRLYNAWISGQYDVPAVARPGTSKHEHGLAIDFGGDLRLAQQLGAKYGLVFPVRGEPWHGQLGEGAIGQGGMDGSFGVQYNLNYVGPERQADPQEVLANRLHAINKILGMDTLTGAPGVAVVDDPSLNNPLVGVPEIQSPVADQPLPEAGARTDEAFNFPPHPVSTMEPDASGTDVQYGKGDASEYGRYARAKLREFGWDDSQMPALIWLWNKESGNPSERNKVTWNPLAQNPHSSAFGIAQFLNGTWAGTGIAKTPNPYRQIDAGLIYIQSRYGSPQNALNFHLRNNWY